MPLSIKKRLERAIVLKGIELKKTKCEHQQLKKALKNIIQAETAEKQNLAEKAKVRREWREAEQQEQEPAAAAEQQEQEPAAVAEQQEQEPAAAAEQQEQEPAAVAEQQEQERQAW